MSEFKGTKSEWKVSCAECGTDQSFSEMRYDSDDELNYSYYCKNCGDVMESNGTAYYKIIQKATTV